jgi:hypothetical protein
VATGVAVTLLLAVAVDWAAARGAGVGGTGTGRRRGPAGALSSYLAHSAGAATAALRSPLFPDRAFPPAAAGGGCRHARALAIAADVDAAAADEALDLDAQERALLALIAQAEAAEEV